MSKTKRLSFIYFYIHAAVLSAVLLPAAPFAGAAGATETGIITRKQVMMGTEIEITISYTSKKKAENAVSDAFDEINRIEKLFSSWLKDSELSEVNRNAGIKPVQVTGELFAVVEKSLEIHDITGGMFDISVGALSSHWNFKDPQKLKVPDKHKLKAALELVDAGSIILDPVNTSIYLPKPGMRISLGGIAKGYAVDMAMKTLKKKDVKNAIVKGGGDIRTSGNNKGKQWVIGIQNPRNKNRLIAWLEVTDISISTSGDYERYFIIDGIRYHHILNPATGYPARGLASATVTGPDTTLTDAIATSLLVMGKEKAIKLIESLPGFETLLVTENGKLISSSGMGGKIK